MNNNTKIILVRISAVVAVLSVIALISICSKYYPTETRFYYHTGGKSAGMCLGCPNCNEYAAKICAKAKKEHREIIIEQYQVASGFIYLCYSDAEGVLHRDFTEKWRYK